MTRYHAQSKARSLLNLLGWIYIGGMIVWFGLRLLFFDSFWWLALINTLAFYLFFPLVVLLPLALWRRHWGLLFGLIAPCAMFAALFGPLLLSAFKAPLRIGNGPAIKIMTFNVLWSNHDYPTISAMIRAAQPDVIGLQEVRPADVAALAGALDGLYPYHAIHPADSFHTVGLLSRFPIESLVALPNPPLERGVQAIVRFDNRPLSILVVHLAPNNMPLQPLSEFVAVTKERYAQRAVEVAYLEQSLRTRTLPTIMMCDCNMTDTSETYARLRSVIVDSFQERGWGFGHTLRVDSVPFPVQRVDYIWHTDELSAVNAYVGLGGGSDHLPMVATFHWISSPL
jgi:vancomycin resistance protein VanJ